jgi:hypothetical protein
VRASTRTRLSHLSATASIVWFLLVGLLILVSALVHIAKTASYWAGFKDVLWWFAPWNLPGFVAILVSLAPGMALMKLGEKLGRPAEAGMKGESVR